MIDVLSACGLIVIDGGVSCPRIMLYMLALVAAACCLS